MQLSELKEVEVPDVEWVEDTGPETIEEALIKAVDLIREMGDMLGTLKAHLKTASKTKLTKTLCLDASSLIVDAQIFIEKTEELTD